MQLRSGVDLSLSAAAEHADEGIEGDGIAALDAALPSGGAVVGEARGLTFS